MFFLSLALLSSTTLASNLPAHYHHDFGKDQFKASELKFMGKEPKKIMQIKSDGVRFAFPDDKGQKVPPVGIGPRFKVRGDFEITIAFQVLREAKPAEGSNGLNLHIFIDTNGIHAATILRTHKPRKGIQLAAHELKRVPDEKEKHVFHHRDPFTEFKSGQLQLKRTGKELSFLAAEGKNSLFHEFFQTEWVADDLHMVRIGGTNSQAKTPFEFRVLSLDIKAQELPPRSTPSPRSFPIFPVLLLGSVIAAAGGIWLWYKRRHSSSDADE